VVAYTAFPTNIALPPPLGPGTSGAVAKQNELHRWQNAGTLVAPAPLGGGSSDVANFEEWLGGTPTGSTILFPPGQTYLQASMVRYLPSRRYVWPGVDEPTTRWKVIDSTAMAATSGMWVPQVWDSNSTTGQMPVEFVHPCLDGNKALTTGGHHGLVMGGSHWWRIDRPYVAGCRGDGIHLTNLAKNGTTVLGNDAADGGIFDVRLDGNLGCGIRQALHASTNAHMDVIVHGGRIFNCGTSGILADRPLGWEISGLKFFVIPQFAIRAVDGWLGLNIHDNLIEDFGSAGGASFWAGISAKGYGGHGASISHNHIRQPAGVGEPGSGTIAYLNLEAAPGAGNASQASADHNLIHGPNASRSGAVGVIYNCTSGTLYVTGKGTNQVLNVNAATSTIGAGTVTSTGAAFV
jgi:hypothetical protein